MSLFFPFSLSHQRKEKIHTHTHIIVASALIFIVFLSPSLPLSHHIKNIVMINKILFHIAVTLDLASVALLVPFLDVFIATVGLKKEDLGWVQAIYGALQAIGLPLAGILAERFGRRPLLLLSMFGTPFSYFICLLSMHFASQPIFILSRILIGATRHTMTVGSAMLLDEAGEEEGQRAKALSGFSAAASCGFVFAPMVGGKIMDLYGPAVLCGCSVVCGLTAGLLMTFATRKFSSSSSSCHHKKKNDDNKPEQQKQENVVDDSPVRKLITAAKKVLIDGGWESRLLVVGMFANSVSYISIQSHTSVYLRNKFQFSGFQVGLTVSFSSFLNAICQFTSINSVVSTSKTSSSSSIITPRRFLLIATWCSSLLGVWTIAFTNSIYFYYFGLIILSLSSGSVDAMSKATLSTYFGNATAIAMSLCYCMDGSNRMLVPLFNSFIMSFPSSSISAPMYLSAGFAVLCSTCHTFGPTAKNIGKNINNIVDDEKDDDEKKLKQE